MRAEGRGVKFTFFIERNLGAKVVPQALAKAGVEVEVHSDHLTPDSPDEDWIRLAGRNGWLAITKDKYIRYRTAEKREIVDARARVIVVRAKNCTGQQTAQLLVDYRFRLDKFARNNDAPFIAGIDRYGRIRKYDL